MSRSGYDTIAPFYDLLARLIYGNALLRARSFLLAHIPAGAHILIVGGGTGWELEQISHTYPSGLTITYIDISGKMIAQARKRNTGKNDVSFIVGDITSIQLTGKYDVILTPFLFDNFRQEPADRVWHNLHSSLKQYGQWLYCDFLNTNITWQRLLLRTMYLFFRWICGIAARELPNIENLFRQHHYRIVDQKFFLENFIAAIVYRRTE